MATRKATPKTDRAHLRASREMKEYWARAAAELGMDLSTFLRVSAVEKAKRTLDGAPVPK